MFGDQMKGTNFWRYTHFPLNHDYGRKGKANNQKKGDKVFVQYTAVNTGTFLLGATKKATIPAMIFYSP